MGKKFVISMDVEVQDHDIITIDHVPNAIYNRFEGTAVHVSNIIVVPAKDEK